MVDFAAAALGEEKPGAKCKGSGTGNLQDHGGRVMFRARWDGEALTPTGHYGPFGGSEAMEPGDG